MLHLILSSGYIMRKYFDLLICSSTILTIASRNVDRLFAMWQTVYPNTYTGAQTATGTSFTIAVGDVEDANSRMRESKHTSTK